MGEQNKVSVKIYGQEYIIAGDSTGEQIARVANFVDEQMHKIAAAAPSCSATNLAVLTAINLADEYFKLKRLTEEMTETSNRQEKDVQHYVQLWEEAKKNFIQYKENAQSAIEENERAKTLMEEKKAEIEAAEAKTKEIQGAYDALKKKNENLIQRLDAQEEASENNLQEMKALEEKCKEVEAAFFDLQMENIQLKGELDRYKKIVE